MRNKYKQLNKIDRSEIEILLDKGYSLRNIANAINKHHTTISREVRRNKLKKKNHYDSSSAEHKSYVRRKYSKYQGKKIDNNLELQEYIIQGLKDSWSPDDISGRMVLEQKPFYASKNSIYRWLNTSRGNRFSRYLYTHRNWPFSRKKYKKRGGPKREMIPNRMGIEKRPKRYLKEFGHWEADTAISGKKTGSKASLSVACERKSMFLKLKKLSSLKPKEFANSLKGISMKSVTMDNGIENRYHSSLDNESYFCDPYSPWQKGKVENSIKMVRRFVKKKSDIKQYSDEYIRMVEYILNNKPRKSLGYHTPYEIFFNQSLKYKKTPTKMGGALGG